MRGTTELLRKTMPLVLLYLLALGLGTVGIAAEPSLTLISAVQDIRISPDSRSHQGEYRNPEYGYAFTIPSGLRAYSDPPPAPHHGVAIPLDPVRQSYI